MPSSRSARKTRTAISPRLATSTLLKTARPWPRESRPAARGGVWPARCGPTRRCGSDPDLRGPGTGVATLDYGLMVAPRAAATVRALTSDSSYSCGGVGVGHDRAADVQVGAAAGDHGRADHDCQVAGAVGRQPAEGAGVRAAAHGLELLDQLHRAHLGRSGHRAGRERGRDEVERVASGGELAGHRRDELMHGRVRLDRAERRARARSRARRRARGRCARGRRSSRSRRGPSGASRDRPRARRRRSGRRRAAACP